MLKYNAFILCHIRGLQLASKPQELALKFLDEKVKTFCGLMKWKLKSWEELQHATFGRSKSQHIIHSTSTQPWSLMVAASPKQRSKPNTSRFQSRPRYRPQNNISALTAHWHLTHCQINTGNYLNLNVVEPEHWHVFLWQSEERFEGRWTLFIEHDRVWECPKLGHTKPTETYPTTLQAVITANCIYKYWLGCSSIYINDIYICSMYAIYFIRAEKINRLTEK